MKRIFVIIVFLFYFPSIYAQDQETAVSGNNDKKVETYSDLIENIWEFIIKALINDSISLDQKMEMLREFIEKYPDDNPYIDDAENFFVMTYKASISKNNISELKELQAKIATEQDIIEYKWQQILKMLKIKEIDKNRKVSEIKEFIENHPNGNSHLEEAAILLSGISETNTEFFSIDVKLRNVPEWFSLSFAAGNYGFGGNLTFVTLRWNNVYWEILRLQAMGSTEKVSANFKTMIGYPFFLTCDYRHEIRFATGISGGFNTSWHGEEDFDFGFSSYLHIPVEISYVYHIKRFFAFQIGFSLDLPVFFDSEGEYIPVISGFTGFRF
ncbi:MAG TPA: hypothetical protein PKG52_07515 [bacterium]|nr:hypothetical protein [bacterium]HPS29441.1 hypothetical protein [bacterium]